MSNTEHLFIELLQVSLGEKEQLSQIPSHIEWATLYEEAERQAIVGVMMDGLERLPAAQRPPQDVLFQWIGTTAQIKTRNQVIYQRCVDLNRMFSTKGWKVCILKGQGNAILYPNPQLRTSGDIDVWVDRCRNDIVDFVRQEFPTAHVASHHIDFPVFKDVDVELHFVPAKAPLLRYEQRIGRFFEEHKNAQFSNYVHLPGEEEKISVPTTDFNAIYQLVHMMKHFFSEGIGMRHLIDYYYVLKNPFVESNKAALKRHITELGMKRFAGAVMWMMKEVLKLEYKYLIVETDEKRGRILMDEVMKGGNFGHQDKRMARRFMRKSATLSVLLKNIRMAWFFPEAIEVPFSNVVYTYIKNKA